jgi:hypothetical protein
LNLDEQWCFYYDSIAVNGRKQNFSLTVILAISVFGRRVVEKMSLVKCSKSASATTTGHTSVHGALKPARTCLELPSPPAEKHAERARDFQKHRTMAQGSSSKRPASGGPRDWEKDAEELELEERLFGTSKKRRRGANKKSRQTKVDDEEDALDDSEVSGVASIVGPVCWGRELMCLAVHG